MVDSSSPQNDLEILTQLNADFLASVQNGDVRRFEQILAEDFMASLPDFLLRDKKQFLDMMAAPRPFTELTRSMHEGWRGGPKGLIGRRVGLLGLNLRAVGGAPRHG